MLYGIEEYDYDEFGLARKEKLKKKKVILIIITIIFVCALLGGIIFYISYNNQNEESSPINVDSEDNITDKIQQENYIDNEEEKNNILGGKNNSELISYKGNHFQIPIHDMDNLKKKFVPQFNENGYNEVRDIYFSDEKQVYLTFDDGPSKDITPQVLDILKEHNVKATFFVLGARVDLYPETLKRTFEEGHYIANHGYSHKYSTIYESKDTVFQEYIDCENSIRNALKNQDYNSYLFRFPGGSSGGRYENVKSEARELFRNYGVAFTNWNCLTGDAEGNETREECIQEMLETKADKNSIVLLMHDSNDKPQTVEALPEIIQHFKDEGYTFKTFYEIF